MLTLAPGCRDNWLKTRKVRISLKISLFAISTATGPNLKQGGVCLLKAKEQPADGKPWVSALSTTEILAPIPEVDSSLASGEAAEISSGTIKPKALPLTVSQAARQGLAKVATPKTLQKQTKQTQSHLGGYVHGLTVTADPALSKPLVQKTTSTSDGALGNWNTAQQVFSEGKPHWDNHREELESRPIKRVLRRSRSAGQSPLTPGRRTGTSGNSKSCPPARLKSSPIKEVMKHGGKTREEQTPGFESAKGDNGVLKNKHSGLPLRRAGMDTSRKLDFFKKPSELPLHLHGTTLVAEKAEGDVLMIDVESLIAADEIRKQAAAVEQIRDAGTKWLSNYPEGQRNSIEQLAVNFLLTMNSTLCFFTVAMRMLSKAPWTDAMIYFTGRQAISNCCYLSWVVC